MRMVSQVPRQARILLVDDRVENLIALDAILSPLDQILVSVQSGEQALEALLAEEVAVVLMDIVMPGMNGLETATRIKHDARTRAVPIIFLTAAIAQPEQTFLSHGAGRGGTGPAGAGLGPLGRARPAAPGQWGPALPGRAPRHPAAARPRAAPRRAGRDDHGAAEAPAGQPPGPGPDPGARADADGG